MKGRTKYNYGKKHLLGIREILQMMDVYNSELSDEEKAFKLYSFCDYQTLVNTLVLCSEGTAERHYLLILQKAYNEYKKKGYFEVVKNPYSIPYQELKYRVEKMEIVWNIINSDASDYNKAYELARYFSNLEQLRKEYSLLIKYGATDERLNPIRDALNNFDKIYSLYEKYEKSGIMTDIRYLVNNEGFAINYPYAKFIIDSYISSDESYKTEEFINTFGIDEDIFDYCVQTVELLDLDLYHDYQMKKQQNSEKQIDLLVNSVYDLANAVNTGCFYDGTPLDVLEFIRRTPFLPSKSFYVLLGGFVRKHAPEAWEPIKKYILDNKISTVWSLNPISVNGVCETKVTVNGFVIDREGQEIIIEYLKQNNIPLINKAYLLAKEKYVKGQIDIEEVKAKMNKSDDTSYVLIP